MAPLCRGRLNVSVDGLGLTIARSPPLLTFLRINEGPGEVAEWPKAPVC